MAHWLRLLLPVQGCGFNPQSGSQDPTCVVLVMSDSVAQSCPTLCNPIDCRPPGPSAHGNLQARKLEWIAILFSRGSYGLRDRTQDSHNAVRFFTV